MRIPAIFDSERRSGLLDNIKKSCKAKKKLEIDFITSKWHTMYLPRLIQIILSLVFSDNKAGTINIGYPTKCKISTIVKVAEDIFEGKYIRLKKKKENQYIPDIGMQKKICTIHKDAFIQDLNHYFNS